MGNVAGSPKAKEGINVIRFNFDPAEHVAWFKSRDCAFSQDDVNLIRYWRGRWNTKLHRWEMPWWVKGLQGLAQELRGRGYEVDSDITIPLPFSYYHPPMKPKTKCYPHQTIGANWLRTNNRAMLLDEMGVGKAICNSELVLTPTGWTTMGEIHVGDLVIGSDGKPTKVLGVYSQGVRPIVRVGFSDGSSVRCSLDHLWSVQHVRYGHRHPDLWMVKTTEEIAGSLSDGAGNRTWRIPMVKPVEFKPLVPPIDPYLYGVLLGDAYWGRTISLSTDEEIVDSLKIEGTKRKMPEDKIVTFTLHVSSITDWLKGHGHPRAWKKTIDPEFLLSSPQDRLALLQGLMDTDGYPMPNGGAEFSSTSRNLVDGVIEIVQSLGGVARGRRALSSTFTYRGFKKQGRMAERVNLKLPPGIQMFRLTRKAKRYKSPTKYPPTRIFGKVEPSGWEEATCIKVTAEDGLFVTRDYILTHNTKQAIDAVVALKNRAVVVCPKSVMSVWGEEIDKHDSRIRTSHWFCPSGSSKERANQALLWSRSNTGLPVEEDWLILNYDVLRLMPEQFLEAAKGRILILDEAHRAKNGRAQVTKLLLKARPKHLWLLTGTPIANRPEDLWSLIHLVCPGRIGWSWWDFEQRHIRRLKMGMIIGYNHLDEIKDALEEVSLRRLKKDCLDLPEKVFEWREVELSIEEKKAYGAMRKDFIAFLESSIRAGTESLVCATAIAGGAPSYAVQFVRLRQIADGLISEGQGKKMEWSLSLSKIKEAVRVWDDAGRPRCVVWSAFVPVVEKLAEVFRGAQAEVGVIHGGVPASERADLVEELNKREGFILIGQTQAMGEGLNLQAANLEIFVDLPLTPRERQQCIDRCHRIGQTGTVTIVDLIAKGTAESALRKRLESKIELADSILESATALPESPEEMLELIKSV